MDFWKRYTARMIMAIRVYQNDLDKINDKLNSASIQMKRLEAEFKNLQLDLTYILRRFLDDERQHNRKSKSKI